MQEPQPSELARLPAVSIFIEAVNSLRLFIYPIIAVVAGGGSSVFSQVTVGLVAAGALGSGLITYLRFGYRVEGEAFVVQGGLFRRFRRVIPLARIQSIDVVQKVRHRVLGVVELRIEAVGGGSTEAVLPAIWPKEAERVRKMLERGRPAEPHEKEVKPVLARLELKDLVFAGLTGGGVPVAAAILGYIGQLFEGQLISRVEDTVEGLSLPPVGLAVLGVGVFVLLASIISIVGSVFTYWNFEVTDESDRLVITRGLLEHRKAHIPLNRIQAIRIRSNPLRRLLGLVTLSVVVAGYRTKSSAETERVSMLLPIGTQDAADGLITRIFGIGHDELRTSLIPSPRSGLVRRLVHTAWRVPIGLGVLLGALRFWEQALEAGPSIILAGFPLAVVVVGGLGWPFLSWARWRALGHLITADHIRVRSGVLVRTQTIAPINNIQQLRMTISPLQRAFGLASITAYVPKAAPEAPDLSRDVAEDWYLRLGAQLVA